MVDLAEGGRHGTERGLHVLGQTRAYILQARRDKLAGQILIEGILENQRHHGEPERGHRADCLDLRHSDKGAFDRVGDQFIDLGRGHGRAFGHDDNLVVGEVGEGVDREVGQDIAAGDQPAQAGGQHEPPVTEGEIDDSFNTFLYSSMDASHQLGLQQKRSL